MPFTFSHPAIILPVNRAAKRLTSLTALVVGSMTPDFEYFIRMKVQSKFSHSWTALLWFDLPLGLLLFYIYNQLVKDTLIDHLPIALNRRFSGFKNSAVPLRPLFIVVVFSVVIGAASHIWWDSFTHPTGYYVKHIPLLKHKLVLFQQPVYFYNILQHISSALGALVIIIVIWCLPVGISTQRKPILYYWLLVFIMMAATLAVRLLTGLSIKAAGDEIVTAISGFFIGLLAASVIFRQKAILRA